MFINIAFWLGSDMPSGLLSFVPALLFYTHSSLLTFFVWSVSYFILAVPTRECLGKYSWMSSPFPIAILIGTSFLSLFGARETSGYYYRHCSGSGRSNHLIKFKKTEIFVSLKVTFLKIIIIIFVIIIMKKGWQCKAGRERLTPYQFEDPSLTIPTHRMKEEKVKTIGDKKGASSQDNKMALDLLLKPASPTPSNTGSTRSFHRDTDRRIKILRYCEVLQRGGT